MGNNCHVNASHFLFFYICIMNRQEKRKKERAELKDKTAQEIIDDAKNKIQNSEKIKHPIWKRILAGALLPMVYVLWTIDRFLHLLLPHAHHDRFKDYMMAKNSVNLTFIRIFIATVILLLLNWIF